MRLSCPSGRLNGLVFRDVYRQKGTSHTGLISEDKTFLSVSLG